MFDFTLYVILAP